MVASINNILAEVKALSCEGGWALVPTRYTRRSHSQITLTTTLTLTLTGQAAAIALPAQSQSQVECESHLVLPLCQQVSQRQPQSKLLGNIDHSYWNNSNDDSYNDDPIVTKGTCLR